MKQDLELIIGRYNRLLLIIQIKHLLGQILTIKNISLLLNQLIDAISSFLILPCKHMLNK